MRKLILCVCVAILMFGGSLVQATIFGRVQGIVHDAQHRPIADVTVVLNASTSALSQTTQTDQNGEFSFSAVPVGDYTVTVKKDGFAGAEQTVTVVANSSPILHFQLEIAPVNQTVTVSASPQEVATVDSVTPTTLVGR